MDFVLVGYYGCRFDAAFQCPQLKYETRVGSHLNTNERLCRSTGGAGV